MKYKTGETKKGQIMLITLFVLSIMAILLVMTLRIVLVDNQQADANEDFAVLDAVAQSITQEYAIGSSESTLDNIVNDCPGDSLKIDIFTVECEFEVNKTTLEANSPIPEENVYTTVKVKDSSIVEVDIKKDEAYSIELTAPRDDGNGFISFSNSVSFLWPDEGPMAVEIFVIFFTDVDAPGNTRYVWDSENEDLRVAYGIFNNGLLPTNPTNEFNITSNVRRGSGVFTVDIRSAMNSKLNNANNVPKSIVIIPRMENSSRNFTIQSARDRDHNSNTIYPLQLREITTTTFDRNDPETPIAEVKTKVPLYPQLDALFYYVLLSKQEVSIP